MSQKNRSSLNNNKKTTVKQKPSFVSNIDTTKEKKVFELSTDKQLYFPIIALIVFVATAVYLLVAKNYDVLFMAQDRSLFVYGNEFFNEIANKPACLSAWAGSYLTQYFYNPTIGASLLIGIWCIIYISIISAFRLPRKLAYLAIIPIACLLISVIDLGYWIYYIKQPGYYFRESLGFLSAIMIVEVVSMFRKKIIIQCIALVAFSFFGYIAFGWYALLACIYVAIQKLFDKESDKNSKAIIVSSATACIVTIPLLCYNFIYSEIRIEDAWLAGFPFFMADNIEEYRCEYPFFVLAFVPMLFPVIKYYASKIELTGKTAYIYILTFIIVAIFAVPYICNANNFEDYNYRAEMRMYKATDESDWDKVLEEAASYETTPTREMVILNHIALLNKGTVGTQMFHYNNFGEAPAVDTIGIVPLTEKNAEGKEVPVLDEKGNAKMDTLMLKVHMVQTAGPIIYYNHAKTNFASRWCIENAVEFGYSIYILKILSKCAIINGEWDVARRYLTILQNTKFYKEWADNYMKIVDNPKTIKNYHEFDYIRELYNNMGTTLDGDNGLCEMYLLNYFSNTMNKDSKRLQELTLAYSLIQKDIQLFWPRFFLYAQLHLKEPMPRHYQEAAYLYGNLEHNVNISNMPFDKDLAEVYASFQQVSQTYLSQGLDVQQVGELMKDQFGSTFFWFYFFCRNVKSY